MERDDQAARVAIEGELSIFTAAGLRERLLEAFDSAAAVEADLAAVTEIDSAGIQLILAARKEAARRGKTLRWTGCSPVIVETLALCGIDGCPADEASTTECRP